MKFQSIVLALAFAVDKAEASPCLAACTGSGASKECTFEVSRDQYASELGYFKFSGAGGDCGGTNPTLGIEKGVTYYFVQSDPSNYYHALGFAYGADGALDDQPELEPAVGGINEDLPCQGNATCPAPMYMIEAGDPQYVGPPFYLGQYSNNPAIAPITVDEEDFGLDFYEPEFFYPLYDWLGAGTYKVALLYPEDVVYEKDFFYFCHIHQFMTGRIKFVDSNGDALYPADEPAIPYPYETPSSYDASCGTFGLEDFQLPNAQCPDKFVCNKPDGAVGKFGECVDSMNCAMMQGMTTNVNGDSAIALFNHQMIPHHQNAVNMCKSLLFSGEADCADLEDEESSACLLNVICQEIINVQNAQIQTMRGILEAEGNNPTDDCVIAVPSSLSCKKCKKKANKYREFNPNTNKCINKCRKDSDMEHAGCDRDCCKKICRADGAKEGCKNTGFCPKGSTSSSSSSSSDEMCMDDTECDPGSCINGSCEPEPEVKYCGCYELSTFSCRCGDAGNGNSWCNQSFCQSNNGFGAPGFVWSGGCSCANEGATCPGLINGVDCPLPP